ncbi:MAG: methylated-DNA--[protein]-cysteine S-methyltransferase [Saprospiraceae bacterium]
MLAHNYYESPLGWIEIKGTSLGIQSVKLTKEKKTPTGDLPPVLIACAAQLKEYFAGERRSFDLKLDWGTATPFNQSVWSALLEIPYGHTTSYAVIAEKIDNPKAVRAVGLANRNNPIAFIVPCHRVIAKNGKLQGYFYGLAVKRALLQLENPRSFATQGTLF